MVTNPNVSSDTFVITKNKASRDMMRKVIIVAGLILFMVIGRSHGQEKEFYNTPLLGVKTNTLYWLTTTINIGAEIGLGKNTTIDLLGTYNPWSFGDNKKIKHWLVQPEFRYWTCERFNGHFWGLHAFYGEFNMGGIKMLGLRKYRYEGTLYGAGIAYGHQWIIGKRWNLETTIGVGYARIEYDKYEYQTRGPYIKKGTKDYIGPTKVGINFIYIIK